MAQIPITNPRIKDNQWLWEAFSGINNGRTYNDFTISDNYWLYLVILAGPGGSGMDIKGDIDCSGNPNYPAASQGDVYRVSVAGKIGGAAGFQVSAGDVLICFLAAAAGTQAAVGSKWNVKQVGLQRAFEMDFATQNLTQTVAGSWTGNVTGNFVFAAANFGVDANTRIVAGDGTALIVGKDAGWRPAGDYSHFFGCNAASAIPNGSGINNSGFGFNVMNGLNAGNNNSAFGWLSMLNINDGSRNAGFGGATLQNLVDGNDNTCIGYYSGNAVADNDTNTALGATSFSVNSLGNENVSIGSGSMANNEDGSTNTVVGTYAMNDSIHSSGCVFLGYSSGYNETGNNKFFVDNQSRGSEANGRLKSLLYGIFDADPALQRLNINAGLIKVPYLTVYANNAAALGAGLVAGECYLVADAVSGSNIIEVVV